MTSSCQGHGGKALAMGGGQWPGPMPPHRARQMPVVGHAVDQGLLARVDVVIGLDQRGAQIQQDQAQAGIADLVKHGVPVGGGHSLRALPRHLGMGVQVIAQLLCHQHEMRVTQVEDVSLEGLYGHNYRDAANSDQIVRDSGIELTIDNEVDRVYYDIQRPQQLNAGNLSLTIESQGFPDVVVWNPWVELCAELKDMPADGWRQMLCVEAAIAQNPISLPAGEEWYGRQTLVAN